MRSLITIVETLMEYEEELNSTFTHDGKDYDINAVFAVEDDLPLYDIPVSAMSWALKYDTPDPARKMKANYAEPILITLWQKQIVVLDGLHRLAKAIDDDLDELPCRFLPPDLLPHFEMDNEKDVDVDYGSEAELYQIGDDWFFGDDVDDDNADVLSPIDNEDFSAEDFSSDW